MQCMHSLQYSNLRGINTFTLLEGACCRSLKCYSTTVVLPSNQTFIILLKPINNRWAWRMVPEEGGATRQVDPIAQSIHDNLWAGTTRQCHTEYQWKLKYLPHTYHAMRDGQEKPGCKYVSPCMQAPATPYIPILGGKLLMANIVSCFN